MIGEIVSKYRILAELGSGSMGTVYKAQDTFLGRFAAVKLMAQKYLDDREALLRFEREGRAASALVHPNICTVFDTGSWRNRPFLAMEFLEGETLSERIQAGRLNLAESLPIAIPVLERPGGGPQSGDRASRHQAGQPVSHAARRREGARLRPGENEKPA